MQIHRTAKTFQFTEIIFINDSKYLWNLQITMRPYAMGFLFRSWLGFLERLAIFSVGFTTIYWDLID